MSEVIALERTDAFTPEQVDLIKRTICKDSTDDELKLFIHVAGLTIQNFKYQRPTP